MAGHNGNGKCINFRLRGQNGKFIGVDSLRGRDYTLTVRDSRLDIVYFEQFKMTREDITKCFEYMAKNMKDLENREVTLSYPNLEISGKKGGPWSIGYRGNIRYNVEVAN